MRRLIATIIAAGLLLLAPAQQADAQFQGMSWAAPPAPSCTGGYQGPGDLSLGSWWYYGSLRAYSCARAGTKAVQLRRASDSTTQDINTTLAGDLDVASATSFCASTTCFVAKLYDQTGNGRDLVQATVANQPAFIFSCNGSHPCYRANAQTHELDGPAVPAGTVASITSVAMKTATEWEYPLLGTSNTLQGYRFTGGSANTVRCADTTGIDETASDNVWHAMLCVINGATSVNYVDTTNATGNAGVNDFTGTTLQVGPYAGAPASNTNMEEAGILFAALSGGNQTTLCHNQRLYWGTTGTC